MEDLRRTQGKDPKKVKQSEDLMEAIMLAMLAAVFFCAMYAIFTT